MSPETGQRQRTRDVQINDLESRRANGKTWIEAINHAYLPWQYLADGEENPMPTPPWYHEGTAFCLEKGLIDSFDDGYFRPGEAASRAVAVEALWRMAGKPEPDADAVGFSDVKRGAAYEKASLWAKARGIVVGTDGMLLPDEALTREQLAVMLCRVFEPEDEGAAMSLAGFEDASDISGWAYPALNWAVRSGLVTGRSGTELAPRRVLTRAELAVIIRRAGELPPRGVNADEPAGESFVSCAAAAANDL